MLKLSTMEAILNIYVGLIVIILMQSVIITTNVVSLNPVHGEVYSIQHYVIKFVSEVQQVVVSSTNKTDRHDTTKILLSGVKYHNPNYTGFP